LGYDTFWEYNIEDSRIVEIAMSQSMMLLTSDGGIMRRRVVRDGIVRALYIPHSMSREKQLGFVISSLDLHRLASRCMQCGGELRNVVKEEVRERIPPKTYLWLDEFMECKRCWKLFWRGTHWKRIEKSLEDLKLPDGKDLYPPI